MKKLFLYSVLAFCFLSLTHKDNAEFKGKVIDHQTGVGIPYVSVLHVESNSTVQTDRGGGFSLAATPSLGDRLRISHTGYQPAEYTIKSLQYCSISLIRTEPILDEIQVIDKEFSVGSSNKRKSTYTPTMACEDRLCWSRPANTESYDEISENTFLNVQDKPLSTFSIDVDGASYSNIRRFITQGQRPPIDAVRIEELINYFDYDYKTMTDNQAFSFEYEIGVCPWNTDHRLVHLGIKGKELEKLEHPKSNLVFLIDVSGSMRHPNKLPLLIKSFNMLVDQLGEDDVISIVTYAGQAGIMLEPTTGNEKSKIKTALNQLRAGGSTAGAQGILTAYELAESHFIKNGNNRVILATDGDFNVGMSNDNELEKLIEEKRENGVFLNVLGFGMGNYKDSKMQRLATYGNGQHVYIDNIHEARKVFVDELQGTLYTIAKDVKIQIEFNPAYVSYYRLIGYENRLLKDQDFNNDKKDAGEIGAGHTLTALYEIIPAGVKSNINNVDPLKYQTNKSVNKGVLNGELATLKMRHKAPDGDKSKKQIWVLNPKNNDGQMSENFYWSAAMACFGMTLRESDHLNVGSYAMAEELAIKGRGKDKWGYRAEALNLIRSAKALFSVKNITEDSIE